MITPEELVKAGLYRDEQSVIDEAMRVFWRERPQLRIEWALRQYQTEDISLARAAAIAGVTYDQFKEALVERGIQPRLGPESLAEAAEEIEVAGQSMISSGE
jgi:predicted HTH domain antitoxin